MIRDNGNINIIVPGKGRLLVLQLVAIPKL